jgi:hypothetical protein
MDQTLAKYYTPHLKILSNLLRPYPVLDYFAIRAIWQGKQVVWWIAVSVCLEVFSNTVRRNDHLCFSTIYHGKERILP